MENLKHLHCWNWVCEELKISYFPGGAKEYIGLKFNNNNDNIAYIGLGV